MNITHLRNSVLDFQEKNQFFKSPVSETVQIILDVGTGDASWAIEVADRYASGVMLTIFYLSSQQISLAALLGKDD